MNLPMFPPGDSPGSNFSELLRRTGLSHPVPESGRSLADEAPHGTTIIALNYSDGVVMAADRRATVGHAIAGRDIEKVHSADSHSGIAISGSAGFGLEMIRLFQLNLEHYEKVEGKALSMEGKASQLTNMVRGHLGLAFQGFVVIPIFAGYDLARGVGRIFNYDVTGGRYEESDFFATGSGGGIARTTVKLGWSEGMAKDPAIELAIQALYEAADEDSATGGPDVVRNIFPRVATITADGYEYVPDDEVAERFRSLIARKTELGHRP